MVAGISSSISKICITLIIQITYIPGGNIYNQKEWRNAGVEGEREGRKKEKVKEEVKEEENHHWHCRVYF